MKMRERDDALLLLLLLTYHVVDIDQVSGVRRHEEERDDDGA
jgi:hypothetical protein